MKDRFLEKYEILKNSKIFQQNFSTKWNKAVVLKKSHESGYFERKYLQFLFSPFNLAKQVTQISCWKIRIRFLLTDWNS